MRHPEDICNVFEMPATAGDRRRTAAAWAEYLRRLQTLPSTGQPGFAAQMAAPPHPLALLGYLTALPLNPNNHDTRYAGATIAMEREAVAELAAMVGFGRAGGGHLTGGGTLANLDGLRSSRLRHPRGAIAFSEDAHFAHERICRLMGVAARRIPCDCRGRIDLDRLEDGLRRREIGTVVLTAGTPGLGAVDAIDDVVALRSRYDFGLHVDASYGGFYTLLCDDAAPSLAPDTAAALAAIADCDSVAIDPHKHAYQPYGCGCILFRDGRQAPFAQDSPYTQSARASGLECSRSGAAAGALWLTLRCLPLRADDGFGPILRACRAGARRLAARLANGGLFEVAVPPELGVVAFRAAEAGGRDMSAACRQLAAAAEAEGVFLSRVRLPAGRLHGAEPAGGEVEVLRAVIMRPEQREFVDQMAAILDRLACGLDSGSVCPEKQPLP